MRKIILTAVLLAAAAAGYYFQTATNDPEVKPVLTVDPVVPKFSGQAVVGQRVFSVKCAACHGEKAFGTANGPPLVHRIYESGHHGDEAFQRAAALGVNAHHWKFGDMPPVTGITRGDIKTLLVYVRELQRANGIN